MRAQVSLRDVVESDLAVFFANQQEPTAVTMAAFTAKDPADETAFQAHWYKIMQDDAVIIKTIIYQGQIAGHVLSYEMSGEREVSYWLGEAFWGKGIATRALSLYLEQVQVRPLYGRAAKDNIGSIRVMEKCGFSLIGEERGFANGRGQEIDEVRLKLR